MISPHAGVEAGMAVYDEPEDMEPGLPRAKAATVKQARADMKLIDEFAKAAEMGLICSDFQHKAIPQIAYDIAFAMYDERCKREREFLEREGE